jgi:hypothetical protein
MRDRVLILSFLGAAMVSGIWLFSRDNFELKDNQAIAWLTTVITAVSFVVGAYFFLMAVDAVGQLRTIREAQREAAGLRQNWLTYRKAIDSDILKLNLVTEIVAKLSADLSQLQVGITGKSRLAKALARDAHVLRNRMVLMSREEEPSAKQMAVKTLVNLKDVGAVELIKLVLAETKNTDLREVCNDALEQFEVDR